MAAANAILILCCFSKVIPVNPSDICLLWHALYSKWPWLTMVWMRKQCIIAFLWKGLGSITIFSLRPRSTLYLSPVGVYFVHYLTTGGVIPQVCWMEFSIETQTLLSGSSSRWRGPGGGRIVLCLENFTNLTQCCCVTLPMPAVPCS